MITPYEHKIIEKVKHQMEINHAMMPDPPHEKDDIPSMFTQLSDEEFTYLTEHRYLLTILEQYSEKFNEN